MKPVERREAADAEHDEVALFARGDAQLRQRAGAGALGREGVAFEQQRLELAASVGTDETGHVSVLYAGLNCADAVGGAASRIF